MKEFEQYLETLPGFETCYTGFNGRKKHIKLIQQIADRYGFEFTIENLRRDLAEKWFRQNRRRLCAAASCAILALGIFYNPVTIPSDAAVAVSTKDIAHVDPDYAVNASSETNSAKSEEGEASEFTSESISVCEFQPVRPTKMPYRER